MENADSKTPFGVQNHRPRIYVSSLNAHGVVDSCDPGKRAGAHVTSLESAFGNGNRSTK
jgi:hypothetical protein